MLSRRLLLPLAIAVIALAIPRSNLAAQSSAVPVPSSDLSAQSSIQTPGLIVPITGVADLGGFFTGALLIQHFAAQANGIVASGVVTGTLVANGTFRNIVLQTTLPLDLNASAANPTTDAVAAQSSCSALHVDLGGVTMNVLGSNIAMNPVAFDVASAMATSAPISTTAPAPAGSSFSSGTGSTAPSLNTTQSFGGTPSSTNTGAPGPMSTLPPTTTTPGMPTTPSTPTGGATPAAGSTPPATSGQTSLATALCSVNGFRDASNPTQLAQQLNAMLTALANPQGS